MARFSVTPEHAKVSMVQLSVTPAPARRHVLRTMKSLGPGMGTDALSVRLAAQCLPGISGLIRRSFNSSSVIWPAVV